MYLPTAIFSGANLQTEMKDFTFSFLLGQLVFSMIVTTDSNFLNLRHSGIVLYWIILTDERMEL